MKKRGGKEKSRLEEPSDYVRIEIESALKRGIPVIPVLVRGASIPAADRLPVSVKDLAYRNGIAIRADPDFHRDMERLIEYLKKQIPTLHEYRVGKGSGMPNAGEDLKKTQSARPRVEPPSTEAPTGMVKVPKGPFLYGEDKRHETIDHDYWIGRYPVTNAEFGVFISAQGYQNQAYWSQEGWTWKNKNNIQSPAYWNDGTWNNPAHPVVGVSYYEAEAYAKWADKRLPTEQEWEKAARGTDGRTYPWGNEFDKNKCNSSESDLGSTSPVRNYPNGVSLYGCYDMAGNVWEWCASWRDNGVGRRVLRGGSWYNCPEDLRSSARNGTYADLRSNDIGFRLVQDIP